MLLDDPGTGGRDMKASKTADNGRKNTPHQFRVHQISISKSKDGAVDTDSDRCGPDVNPKLLLQPETKAISHDQLVAEVRGIYAGLVMVEAKCIDVDEKQFSAALENHSRSRLNPEQWQALIALHRTLLHEHHDFFLASQHPFTSSALSHLAAKYSIPARMWSHAIHAFLEVLRHRLPESLDHMLAFIYIAYSMMALLYETVPAFEDTWIECFGDIARYRMAIEDDSVRDVTHSWYGRTANRILDFFLRRCHHLAALARQDSVLQLNWYTRAMDGNVPFDSRRGDLRLLDPVPRGEEPTLFRSSQVEPTIRIHGLLFLRQPTASFLPITQQLLSGSLDTYRGRITTKSKEQSICTAITNIASLFEYGHTKEMRHSRSVFRLAYEEYRICIRKDESVLEQPKSTGETEVSSSRPLISDPVGNAIPEDSSNHTIEHASFMTFSTFAVALRRIGNKNVIPLVHTSLLFLGSLINTKKAVQHVGRNILWLGLASLLDNLAKAVEITLRVLNHKLPESVDAVGRPFPEDFLMRGQLWSESYFPASWFTNNAEASDEERSLELQSMTAERIERTPWLASWVRGIWSGIARYQSYVSDDGATRLKIRCRGRSLLSAALFKELTWATLLHGALAQSDRGGTALGYEEDWLRLGYNYAILQSWIPVIFGLACVVGSSLYVWWCGRSLIVSSTMMGVMSLIWANVYGDVRTNPQLFWTVFGLQMHYTYAYGAEQFYRLRMTTGYATGISSHPLVTFILTELDIFS